MFLVCCSQHTKSEEMPMEQNGAPPHYAFCVCVRAICLSAALLAVFGCAGGEHKQQQVTELPPSQSQPLAATPLESPHKSEQAEIQETAPELPGGGQTPWAKGFEGELIMGLDGQLYDAYNAATIKHVQTLMEATWPASGSAKMCLYFPRDCAVFQNPSPIGSTW